MIPQDELHKKNNLFRSHYLLSPQFKKKKKKKKGCEAEPYESKTKNVKSVFVSSQGKFSHKANKRDAESKNFHTRQSETQKRNKIRGGGGSKRMPPLRFFRRKGLPVVILWDLLASQLPNHSSPSSLLFPKTKLPMELPESPKKRGSSPNLERNWLHPLPAISIILFPLLTKAKKKAHSHQLRPRETVQANLPTITIGGRTHTH